MLNSIPKQNFVFRLLLRCIVAMTRAWIHYLFGETRHTFTRISLAFSCASWRMKLTICRIWSLAAMVTIISIRLKVECKEWRKNVLLVTKRLVSIERCCYESLASEPKPKCWKEGFTKEASPEGGASYVCRVLGKFTRISKKIAQRCAVCAS